MRTPERTFRKIRYLLLTLTISAALAACGGGGGGSSTSPGVAGPATVSVSIASAPSYPAGTTFASSTSSPTIAAAPGNSTTFDNVLVTVTKLALIPSTGPELPDASGEEEKSDSSEKDGNGFVTATLAEPVTIDLRHLMPDNAAMLLNQFSGVPAGEYSKIRVYYNSVVGQNADGNTTFHPTAHYHFDVHFVGGNLVIPVAAPQDGIRFYSVVIDVVGLKTQVAGNSGNVLLRPQVFAKVVGVPRYIVHGIADQVNHSTGTFVVKMVNDNVDAAYDSDTRWFYADGRLVGPFPDQPPSLGVSGVDALQDNAIVDVIGTFQGGKLVAEEVDITFPLALRGEKVFLGWTDNTFILRFVGDNVVSMPGGRRDAAYWDNAGVTNYPRITGAAIDTAIVDNVLITARGYATDLGVKAYWISVGP